MIFVDSDAYIAIHAEKDSHPSRALKLMEELIGSDEQLVTSWQVADEVATKLSYFTTKKNAVKFLRSLLRQGTRIEYVDAAMAIKVAGVFLRQTSKRISLTDCANMAIARKLGVQVFLSFDEHYVQNGFRLFGN